MLYLAEVQKQKGGLLSGGAKTELKLLACQRKDQIWSTVNEEVIAAEEASKLNDGALVLAELNATRQVQRLQEAGRPLVTILQNFSRQLEKFKVKEEEIDQWKESLTFQGQELSRREMDLEAREEQVQQIEQEAQQIDAKLHEVESSREEIQRLQEEIDRNRQELEGAWEHLRGEQRRLEELGENVNQGAVLDEEQTRVISDLLEKISHHITQPSMVREHLDNAFEMVEAQQSILHHHFRELEKQKAEANEHLTEVERLSALFQTANSALQQAQDSFYERTAELKSNTVTLETKQEYLQMLQEQLQQQQELYQQLNSFNDSYSSSYQSNLTSNVDAGLVESLSIEELKQTVQDLQHKLNIDSSFVEEQEQELNYKQRTIDELQEKINSVSEKERSAIEEELADEKDSYQMLNETLVGQRRSLVERQESLTQHETLLSRREGNTQQLDLSPIVNLIESQRQNYSQQVEQLQAEIDLIHSSIQATEGIEPQSEELDMKRQELQTMQENLFALQTANAQTWATVNLYEETLQPIQESLDGLRHKLQAINEALTQLHESGDCQLQAVTEMRSSIENLIPQ
ncbi:pilus motility taxis protein HmpF [Rivularia sp. UHCC 0363]|uniref:pilus motility taxis protein HmpF n=1 Tax=Rivularia sp. UHCC 0363 TaxID=3110244 RepID=UPI002B1EDE5B|nr:pilus motility taxis protein HmpF [Rivularia sp. UHCC 0363]MEA5593573.1 pilus motility taxis protein HmpF [Rivularia sp. UHCC 0363]